MHESFPGIEFYFIYLVGARSSNSGGLGAVSQSPPWQDKPDSLVLFKSTDAQEAPEIHPMVQEVSMKTRDQSYRVLDMLDLGIFGTTLSENSATLSRNSKVMCFRLGDNITLAGAILF